MYKELLYVCHFFQLNNCREFALIVSMHLYLLQRDLPLLHMEFTLVFRHHTKGVICKMPHSVSNQILMSTI